MSGRSGLYDTISPNVAQDALALGDAIRLSVMVRLTDSYASRLFRIRVTGRFPSRSTTSTVCQPARVYNRSAVFV